MVTWIRLMGDRRRKGGGPHREIRVDVDPRAPPAVEPIVGAPRLIPDEPDVQPLAVGKPEQLRRSHPKTLDQPGDDDRQTIDRYLEPRVPRGKSLPDSALAGEKLVDARRRVVKSLVRDPRGGVIEAAGDLVEIRKTVAGKDRRLGLERDQLDIQPVTTVRFRHLVGQSRAKSGGIVAKARAGARLLHVDLRLERRGPEVAIDETLDVLVEAQAEDDVVARHGIGWTNRPLAADRRHADVRRLHRCIFSGRGARGASWSRWASAWRRASARRSARAGSVGRPARSGERSREARAIVEAGAPDPTPPVSPTNGSPDRSTASRLIRSAAVFCSATSRT